MARNRKSLFVSVTLLGLVLLGASLWAQDTAPPPAPAAAAAATKIVGLAAAVLLLLQGAKRLLDQFSPGLVSGKGAVLLALVFSVIGNIAAADPNTGLIQIVLGALLTAIGASGGHDLLSRFGTGKTPS